MESATLALDHPIEAGGQSVTALRLRMPTVRDLRVAQKAAGTDQAEAEVRLFANLCEVAPDTIESMSLSDYERLQQLYQGFFRRD